MVVMAQVVRCITALVGLFAQDHHFRSGVMAASILRLAFEPLSAAVHALPASPGIVICAQVIHASTLRIARINDRAIRHRLLLPEDAVHEYIDTAVLV